MQAIVGKGVKKGVEPLWLRIQWVEYNLARLIGEERTYTSVQHWEKRMNASQRRYMRACETLARIRKMKLPPVQINVARQQMNQVRTG